uniref:PRANC domain-containing protein n=1 Tax=Trichogramma kaykai TaxID=54128 RepID=A0ABD2X5P7_9HYME
MCRLINDWKSRLPDLREIFRREEIDWLLTQSAKTGPVELISFVIRTGYRDEPDLDEDGKPLLCRNTPVHYAAKHKIRNWISKIRELFKIYDKFNVNYTNESGFTHFHVACMSGCDEIVEKFLELGQDPNISMKETSDTSLHLALKNRHTKTIELLLRNGADPNLSLHLISSKDVDDDVAEKFFKICDDIQQKVQIDVRAKLGFTPLHLALHNKKTNLVELLLKRGADSNVASAAGWRSLHIISMTYDDIEFVEKFFQICEDMQQKVQIAARSDSGDTALHVALRNGNKKMSEWLLRRGIDPNSSNQNGSTPLHIICEREADDDENFAEKFFQICEDMQQKVQVDARDKLGWTPLHFASHNGHSKLVESLLRRGADPNSADEKGSTPLHNICSREQDDNLAEKFFEICEELQQKIQVDARDKLGDTPLHLALKKEHRTLVESLLRHGVNPNLADAEGLTPLHLICIRDIDDEIVEVFFKICDDMQQKVQVDAVDKSGNTPLHGALRYGSKKKIELLLRRGANPNKANEYDIIPLHYIALRSESGDLTEWFFHICNDMQKTVEVDIRMNMGQTPLHWALLIGNLKTIECLLTNGADPNLFSVNQCTPLQIIALRPIDDYLMQGFFQICDKIQLRLQVDARDKFGFTPLHNVLYLGKKKSVEWLLRGGADPNLANGKGFHPLHIISCRDFDGDLVKLFFEITDDVQQTVQVDAQDKLGRTPLQTAVANISPGVVDVLLDRGADLSKFAFPIEKLFRKSFDKNDRKWDKLKLASGTLVIVERLENSGYDLSRSDALTIIDSFVKYGLFEKSSDLSEKCWYEEEEFTSKSKEIIIIPSLSLYDLIHLRPEEEDKLLTYTNYFEVERSDNLDNIPEKYRDLCLRHLCEKMSRGYVQRLALDSLLDLTRMPILCCEKIIEKLKIEDLLRICKAVDIPSKENRSET